MAFNSAKPKNQNALNMPSSIVSKIICLIKPLIGRRILGGPFRGMQYTGENSGSTLMPKILGTYELELAEPFWSWLRIPNLKLLDIGAAEGYYSVGTLFLNKSALVTAFEMNANARAMLNRLAEQNEVSDRLKILGECRQRELIELLSAYSPDVLIVDVEGAEFELLCPEVVELLKTTRLVVEIHPWAHPNMQDTLSSRLGHTHEIQSIPARRPKATEIRSFIFRFLASLSPSVETRLLQERPPGMSWLIAEPKTVSENSHA
jgi:hypothetical protein